MWVTCVDKGMEKKLNILLSKHIDLDDSYCLRTPYTPIKLLLFSDSDN
jgi:hypothetical protein